MEQDVENMLPEDIEIKLLDPEDFIPVADTFCYKVSGDKSPITVYKDLDGRDWVLEDEYKKENIAERESTRENLNQCSPVRSFKSSGNSRFARRKAKKS